MGERPPGGEIADAPTQSDDPFVHAAPVGQLHPRLGSPPHVAGHGMCDAGTLRDETRRSVSAS